MKEYIKEHKNELINSAMNITIILLELILIFVLLTKKEEVKAEVLPINETETKEEIKTIKIEVKGAVNYPGVYEIEENSRVIDAINLAGGTLENANTSIINLSKKLEDEMVIIIYTNEDIQNYKNDNKKIEYIYLDKKCECPDTVNKACINNNNVYATEETNDETTNESNQNTTEQNKLININTASSAELITLTGIGESKAQKIIEYRTKNGNFKNIDELQNVDGIGTSIIEKIKDQITI